MNVDYFPHWPDGCPLRGAYGATIGEAAMYARKRFGLYRSDYWKWLQDAGWLIHAHDANKNVGDRDRGLYAVRVHLKRWKRKR